MRHDVKYTAAGWTVTTRIGSLTIATIIVDTFAEALSAWARLEGC